MCVREREEAKKREGGSEIHGRVLPTLTVDTICPERGPQPESPSSACSQDSMIKPNPIIGSSHKGPAKVANWNPLTKRG